MLRLAAAVAVGKALILLLRILGRAGTTLPGRVSLVLAPNLINHICQTANYRIVVTGTNGKTTTSAMLEAVLRRAGRTVVRNVSGANLASGVATALVERAGLGGRLSADVLILELDEAAIARLAPKIRPHLALVTNLFRDQLDRFGELDRTAALVRSSLSSVREVACLNADDPQVAELRRSLPAGCHPLLFGLEATGGGSAVDPGERVGVDVQHCPDCGTRFTYRFITYGHLGDYRCPECAAGRPQLSVSGRVSDGDGDFSRTMLLHFEEEAARRPGGGDVQISLRLPGIYNAYNAVAAAAAAISSGVAAEDVRVGLEEFSGAFGRMERVILPAGEFRLALVKNPAGFNEVLRTVGHSEGAKVLVVAINDHAADGRDISWLWDVRFRPLVQRSDITFIASGLRAHDMAVRLKYAQVDADRIEVSSEPSAAVDAALRASGGAAEVYVLCTYTAMLALRAQMSARGAVPEMWEGGG